MGLIPVILSGGAGTRLWPVSRELHPKPFMRLPDGESLLQKAFKRAAALPEVSEVLTVTGRDLYFKTRDEYKTAGVPGVSTAYVLEPFGRNTAPAIAIAAGWAAATHGPDAVLLVLAADHLITRTEAFGQAVARAVALARTGKLVCFGIRPDAPETGYGYIEADGETVRRFVEKPDLNTAKEYVASGRFLWNSGIFCFRAGTVLEQLAQHAPEVAQAAQRCLDDAARQQGSGVTQLELASDTFSQAPDISIDYALMEKSNQVAVVPCEIGWSDIGSWAALSELTPADEAGNRTRGEVVVQGSTGCFIQSEDRVVGAVGLRNLIIVDTPDALLVAERDKAQDVKGIVAQLKKRGHEAYKLHREVHRPWGTYTTLEEGPRFKIKRIVVRPGASLSLQMHYHRSEHWIVVSGMARVVNGERELLINTNESTYIPAGHKHRLENPGLLDLVMIEVQSGEYLGEDDIVRFEDIYGRAQAGKKG